MVFKLPFIMDIWWIMKEDLYPCSWTTHTKTAFQGRNPLRFYFLHKLPLLTPFLKVETENST